MASDDISELIRLGDEALLEGRRADARVHYRDAFRRADKHLRPGIVARMGFLQYQDPSVLLGIQQLIEGRGRLPVFVGDGLATWMKTNSFVQRTDFLHYVDKHSHLLPLANWHWNLQTVEWALRQARDLPGDFVELGVFRGHTTIVMAEYLGFADWPRRWYLYDTFEGIPDDHLNAGWAGPNERAYKGTYSYEEVRERFAEFPNIEVIQGRVPEILAERCPDKIAFLHMDLNSAVAEIAALEFLYDRITPGGIIVFDDYGWFVSAEQQTAESQWMQAKGLRILELPTGQGLFIKPA